MKFIHYVSSILTRTVPVHVALVSMVFGALGGAMFVLGEYDDAPGAMLIGFVLVVYGFWRLIRRSRDRAIS